MNKQEMAEWLAENVLGWKRLDSVSDCQIWRVAERSHVHCDRISEEIYTPDGFFAVWDAVEKLDRYSDVGFWECQDGYVCHLFFISPARKGKTKIYHEKLGKDRYEAFYNAVKQAWKE